MVLVTEHEEATSSAFARCRMTSAISCCVALTISPLGFDAAAVSLSMSCCTAYRSTMETQFVVIAGVIQSRRRQAVEIRG
jgi:hypothetical protein